MYQHLKYVESLFSLCELPGEEAKSLSEESIDDVLDAFLEKSLRTLKKLKTLIKGTVA